MRKTLIPMLASALALLGCASDCNNNKAITCNKVTDDLSHGFTNNPRIPTSFANDTDLIMSKAYWNVWNEKVQKEIDERIEKYRKANASLKIADIDTSKSVKVKQVSHKFIFGAHIFNFNQLGKKEYNDTYKSLYGSLFNSATIAFYWKTFEMEFDKMRFETEYWDTEEFWNNVKHPKTMPHWRRPSTDQIVEFCEQKGIRMHGHPLVWGNRRWHCPEEQIFQKYAENENQIRLRRGVLRSTNEVAPYLAYDKKYKQMPLEEFEKHFANIADILKERTEIRVREIAKRYGDKIHSWDVVNESASDFSKGNLPSKSKRITRSVYGIMEPDYDFNAFMLAQKYLPKKALLNINDYNTSQYYLKQIESLGKRGCEIDIVGAQMHLFNPKLTLAMSNGDFSNPQLAKQTPTKIKEIMDNLSKAGKPIHLSEITVTAAGTSHKDRMKQAVALRNLYRMWFSIEKMMGITMWNVVDDCGAPGEPTLSGLFTRDMQPKPAYHAINNLINKEWKTNTITNADTNGNVAFRGFRGKYEISYTDKNGKQKTITYNLE